MNAQQEVFEREGLPIYAKLRNVFTSLFDREMYLTDYKNPLVILGTVYSPKKAQNSSESNASEWPNEFLEDVYSLFWLRYRSGFHPINCYPDKSGNGDVWVTVKDNIESGSQSLSEDESNQSTKPFRFNEFIHSNLEMLSKHMNSPGQLTSDTGWGCMIRTAQSLLANTLVRAKLGRDWRYSGNSGEKDGDDVVHREIAGWFIDDPSAPFAIHRMVNYGYELFGKRPGEWFGPSAAAHSIKQTCDRFAEAGLKVYVGSDTGNLFEDEYFAVSINDEGIMSPTLILLTLRLGIDNVNQKYWKDVKDLLSLEQSVGIAGGRPKSSFYFYGFQGDCLFYLDPHSTSCALKTANQSNLGLREEDIHSLHCREIRGLNLKDMDPSMLVGFFIKDKEDYEKWRASVSESRVINIFATDPVQGVNFSPNRRSVSISFSESEFDDDVAIVDVDMDCDVPTGYTGHNSGIPEGTDYTEHNSGILEYDEQECLQSSEITVDQTETDTDHYEVEGLEILSRQEIDEANSRDELEIISHSELSGTQPRTISTRDGSEGGDTSSLIIIGSSPTPEMPKQILNI